MSPEQNIFNDFLRHKKLRFSKQRKTITQVFLQVEDHVEIGELCERAKIVDEMIGKSTVYRTMNLLLECGLAKESITIGDRRIFERVYERGHHDHMICSKCRKIMGFFHPLIEKFQQEIADQHLFTISSHRMTLFGICQDCK